MIYFDNAATTEVRPEVVEAVTQVLMENWGNPSSLHRLGFQAERRLEGARESIAGRLGAVPSSLFFTSCATESNNTALRGLGRGRKGKNIVITAIEHDSIEKLGHQMQEEGTDIRVIPVDKAGRVDPDQAASLVDENTVLLSCMMVNNELGTIEEVEKIGRRAKKKNPGLYFHVDAVQALGKFPIRLKHSTIDLLSASGHKIHAPKGVGLLYVRPGVPLQALMVGGGQERGMRPGTENTAFAVGMARALELMEEGEGEVEAIYRRARERMGDIPDTYLNSPSQGGSPYILNFGIAGVKAEVLIHAMERQGMYLSSGSACAKGEASHVIQAIGTPEDYREGCIRLSFSDLNRLEEVDPFFDQLEKEIDTIRRISGYRKK